MDRVPRAGSSISKVGAYLVISLSNEGNPTNTIKNGIFWLGNREVGATNYQLGLRWDVNYLDNQSHGEFDFLVISASSAVVH